MLNGVSILLENHNCPASFPKEICAAADLYSYIKDAKKDFFESALQNNSYNQQKRDHNIFLPRNYPNVTIRINYETT